MVVNVLHRRCQSTKSISILLKIRKDIFRATSILMSANRKVFLKTQNLFSLSFTEKEVITILKMSILEPSIF